MFLQELDRIEKRKHEEQEREVLIKAAKVCQLVSVIKFMTQSFKIEIEIWRKYEK